MAEVNIHAAMNDLSKRPILFGDTKRTELTGDKHDSHLSYKENSRHSVSRTIPHESTGHRQGFLVQWKELALRQQGNSTPETRAVAMAQNSL